MYSSADNRIALIGMPNTGKSTFFNRITGASAKTGNWPGITVDLLSSKLILGSRVAEIIDLPGIYDIHGYSEDEKVVEQFLATQSVALVVLVLNAVQLDRQWQLADQFAKLGYPILVLLNMADEADALGMRIDTQKLSQSIQSPVMLMSAKKGKGVPEALQAINTALHQPRQTHMPSHKAETTLMSSPQAVRAFVAQCMDVPKQLHAGLTERIDRILLHPIWGIPLFFVILLCMFQGVYWLGGPIQDTLDTWQSFAKVHWVMPLLHPLHPMLQSFLLDGLWDGLMTVATFVPIVILFFLFVALLEDTGYFSRVAYLMDAFMARLGLDGRGFVMVLMGFGCNVPALMGTRIMRSRSNRLLTMLIIPFSLCSARLQVFVFMIGLLFARQHAGFVLFSLYVMGFLAAILTALVFKGRFSTPETFIIELPPYRLPTVRMLMLRSWHEVHMFLKRATQFITLGVIAIWALTHLPWGVEVAGPHSLAGMLGHWAAPVFEPIGINEKLSISLLFGFIAKEIVVGSLAVIYGLQHDALAQQMAATVTALQAYSFMLFVLIYTPCLATLATLKAESKQQRFMWLSLFWSLGLAWVVSFVVYQVGLLLGF